MHIPLKLPENGLPSRMGTSYLGRLWKVDYRAIARWHDEGMLEGQFEGLARVFRPPAVEAFARDATVVRLLKPNMTVRCPSWEQRQPVRIIEARPEGVMWMIAYRTVDGVLVHARPCPGGRVLLQGAGGEAGAS